MSDNTSIELFLKEMSRKVVHIFSIIIPIFYHFVDKQTLLFLLILILAIMLYFEYSRIYSTLFYHMLIKLFLKIGVNLKHIIRSHEENNLTGASYMIIAMIIVCLFSQKVVFITAFSILAISDTMAALIGIQFGTHKIFNKSVEGSIAFFISALIISCLILKSYEIEMQMNEFIFLAGISTIAELVAKKIKIDDNLLIPITFAITYSLLISSS